MRPRIANAKGLGITPLRRDALRVLEAGLRAADPGQAVRERMRVVGSKLSVDGKSYDLDRFDHVYLIGIGKASLAAAQELERLLKTRITDGLVLDVREARLNRVKSVAGSHPFPSLANMRATGEIMGILKQVDSRDLVIAVVSGGGSALLCWPFELKCDDLVLLTRTMMARGATIREINAVRKHLSEIQGGQFARLAFPATVLGLVFSDVPGDDLGTVASGPTVMDDTTVRDAERVLKKYDLLKACRLADCNLRETPKDPVYFRKVKNVLILSNRTALAAMKAQARRLGYRVRILSHELTGEAREVGARLAKLPKPGEMVLAGGETTVTVRGKGKGGRNQEAALSALASVPEDGLFLACASDGVDNSPAAGAIADAAVREAAREKRLLPNAFLARNDAFSFFEKAGGQLRTGITGTNVSDLFLASRAKSG